MSKMIVVSIDDNAKADAFLAALQEHKVVAFPTARGSFVRAPVLFAYLTDANNACSEHSGANGG